MIHHQWSINSILVECSAPFYGEGLRSMVIVIEYPKTKLELYTSKSIIFPIRPRCFAVNYLQLFVTDFGKQL